MFRVNSTRFADLQEGGQFHFIVKGDSGSQVFPSFRHLYAALGRSALHVAALRGTGHPLALAAPRSWLLSRLLSSPQLGAFRERTPLPAAVHASGRVRPWTPPTFGPKSNSSARLSGLGALLSKLLGSDLGRRWPVGWFLDWGAARSAAAEQSPGGAAAAAAAAAAEAPMWCQEEITKVQVKER